MACQVMRRLLKDILTDAIDGSLSGAGCLSGTKMTLFVNDIDLDQTTEYGDLEQPDWSSYSDSATLTFSDPVLSNGGGYEIVGPRTQFTATSGVPTQSVVGYGVYRGSPGSEILLFAEKLEDPEVFSEEGDSISIVPKLTLPVDLVYGNGAVVV